MAASSGDEASALETLANSAIATGCLQAVMSMVHPELVKFVAFQKERVARTDAERERNGDSSRYFRRRGRDSEASEGATGSNLGPEQQNDLSFQLKYLRQHWHSHLRLYGLDRELPGVVQRALMYRNKVAHQSQLSLSQYSDAIATFEKLADIIECNALIRQQIRDLVTKLMAFAPSAQAADSNQAQEVAEKKVQVKQKKESQPDPVSLTPTPPPATLDQILQHNYLYDEEEDALWVDLKLIGNDYFKEGNYTEAIEAYSQGLDVAPNKAVLFGNRAMCFLRMKEFERAREDAEDAMDADNYENVKYYRLLSEAMMGMKDYDEVKEICIEGLELEPEDATLLSRRRTAEVMIEKEKIAAEKEKRRRELEERAKIEAANAEAAAKQARDEANSAKSNAKSSKKKNKPKDKKPEIELVRMINYQDVPAKWIETHTRGSRRLELYQQGMESLVVGAQALLQVTDSIGMPGRSKLPLDKLVREGMMHLRKAGEAGVAEAWFRLGVLNSSSVRKGIPLTADPREMLECFHKAAAMRPFIKPPGNRVFPHQGVAEAENELGVCYRDGIPAPFVQADLKKAFQFFLRSAEHDFPVGQYNVAIAYSTGSGIPVDAFAARMWTSRAAQHGLPEAQRYLAQFLKTGYGGKRDERQAREWTLTAAQNQLTDLVAKHDFADVGVTALGGGEIAEKFASDPTVSQRGRDVFKAFYDAYLDDDTPNNEGKPDGLNFDDDDIQITKVSSYTQKATSSSSDQLGWSGIYRQPSAVIDAEIQSRAKAGGVTASKYLVSEKLLSSAGALLVAGDIRGALRDLRKADLIWERPKGVFTAAGSSADLMPKVLKEAGVSLQLNARDIDAAYVVGRWEFMSDQDIISHWKRCIKIHPDEAAFHFFLGAAYLTIERYNDAMDAMETALSIETKPDWLYWFASPMIGLGMMDSAVSVLKQYVDTYPPDERFMPDAYYSLGALYLKQFNNTMATVYHELGQLAESVAIRFPAFHPRVLVDIPKETLRSGMKKNGYMESSVIASVLAENMVECGYCKSMIKPTQLLSHKLSKCPRRTVVCPDCNDHLVFDALQAHRQSKHPSAGKKKGKGKAKAKKRTQSAPAPDTNQPLPAKVSDKTAAPKDTVAKELTSPKFHFAGAILEVTKGKSNSKQTVFTLKTAVGQRWTIRVNHNFESCISDSIDGATVDNSMLVFWRRSPPLEMIDRRALVVPADGEAYGKDVVIYVLKCSIQALAFELCQLRHNKYVENGSLCSACNIPAIPGEGLSACSACKVVKYCSRDCQRSHWKRIHRHMCSNAVLLGNCTTMSEDVTPDERVGPAPKKKQQQQERKASIKQVSVTTAHEEAVYVESTLEILEGVLSTAIAKGESERFDVAEYYMLPPRDPSRPGKISGSVRILHGGESGNDFVAEFCIGYLLSEPTMLQQEALHYFFQIPPHNPLKLKYDETKVFLAKCKVYTDDDYGRGFRLAMRLPVAVYPLPAIAELLDYLLANTNMYLT